MGLGNKVLGLTTLALISVGVYIVNDHIAKYNECKKNTPAPILRDINNDGIEDKITSRAVWSQKWAWDGFLYESDTYSFKKDTSYGVKYNGKTVYIPKETLEDMANF